ncbi:MAG TPA: VOC family protein [Candidatus Nanopelagicaceae bacterium]|nr:VOC family protein [Candidatus Nanopelagicaceae bacterium]
MSIEQKGLPGLRGTEHIGFTVPDLDQATDFFVNVIGCELVYSLGPFEHQDSDWMLEHLNVHPRTVMRELRFFRCGHGPNFEVFQFEPAEPPAPQPKNSDIGGHHLAFYVDDFDLGLAHLRSHNVRILGEPTFSKNASEGQRWVYFLSPWGMQLELVSFPSGKAYEKTSKIKLWHPANPSA